MSVRCGTALSDITPPPGLPMGGYAARTDVANGRLDGLACRALVCEDGSATLALVILDLLYVAEPWAGALRRRLAQRLQCPPAHVLVAATHTHAAPAVFRSALVSTAELTAYETHVADTVVDTVVRAHAARQAVRLAFGTAAAPGVSSNRIDATRGADGPVRALVAHAPAGECVAAAAVYACHPTVLPPANRCYSRDLFGVAVDAAEQHLGAPVLLFNGAAADVSTRFTRRGQDVAELARLGHHLGAAIAAAVRAARPLASAPLRGWWEEIAVAPRRLPTPAHAQAEVAAAAERVGALQECAASAGERRRAAAELEGALAQLHLATHGGVEGWLGRQPERAPIQLLHVGGCDVLAAPGELFSEVGLGICARRGSPALVVGYANDYLGYFVDTDAATAGAYEAQIAVLEPASAASIAQRLATIGLDGGDRGQAA